MKNATEKTRGKKRRWLIPVSIGGVILILAVAGVANAMRNAREALTQVETVTLERTDLVQTLLVSGTVHSNSREEIAAPSSLKVLDVLVDAGSVVKQGDVLAVLDTRTLELDIRSAKLSIENAQNTLDSTAKDLGISAASANNSIASARVELESAQRSYDDAKAQAESQPSAAVQSAKAELDIAQRKYDELEREGLGAASVKSAKAELDTAQRKYDDVLATAMKSAAVQSAKMDYDTAQKKYAEVVNDGADEAISNAWKAHTNAKDQLVTTTTVNNAAVSKAQAEVVEAQKKLENVSGEGDAAKELAELQLKLAKEALASAQASMQQAVKQAQLNIDTTFSQYESTIDAQDDAVESAWNAREKARLNYESAVKNADESIVSAKEALDRAALSYDNAVKAVNDGLVSAKDALDRAAISYESALKNQSDALANAHTAFKRAQTSYESARINQSSAQGKNTDSARIALEQQQITLEKLEQQLENATMIAPMDGTVTYCNAAKGEYAAGLMFVIEDVNDLTVKTSVGETDVGALEMNQQALVRTDGTGEEQFTGEVAYISPAAEKTAAGETSGSTNVLFGVRVDITQPDPRVRIGMNARLTILMDEKKDVLAVPVEAVTLTEQGDTIFIMQDGAWQAVAVTLGMQTDTMVEISAQGLSEGMTIAAYGNPLEKVQSSALQVMGGMRGGVR